jgi:integrase
MADERYLKKRRQGWYFVIAVPRELRGNPPWGTKAVIVQSLRTRDLSVAQKERWARVTEYTEAFRRAAGDIPLTRAEIDMQARRVYRDTLASLEAKPVLGDPHVDETSEQAALGANINDCSEALDDPDFCVSVGEHGEGTVSLVADEIVAIEKRIGEVIAPKTETWRLVGEAILKARIAAMEGRLRALGGEPSEPPATFVLGGIDRVTLKPVARSPRPKIRTDDGGKSFSEVSTEYIAELQRDKSAKLTEQTRGQHEMAFRLFGQYVDNAPLVDIDRAKVTEFLNDISKLSPNWGRASNTKKLTVWQLIEQFGDGDAQLSNKTLNRYISSLSGLFKWARRRGYFDGTNPFSEQSRPKPRKGAGGWLPYTVDELNTLFGSPRISASVKERIHPKKHSFETALRWVPLIALFSGMRLGEICQLATGDLKRERNIWYFNVTEEGEGQQIKTDAGVRKVPLHSTLIKCGVLSYLKELPEGQLFPGLTPGGPDGKLSWYFTRRFTEYRRKLGVDRQRVAFHSFRKNVATALDNEGVPQADVAAILGHERGFTFSTYSKGLEMPRLRQVVEKIKYPDLRLTQLYV